MAERVSNVRSEERLRDDPNIETYLMGVDSGPAKNAMNLDALLVRNHAAFAAFACSAQSANIAKEALFSSVWDQKVPHVGFFATREIEPGEELLVTEREPHPDRCLKGRDPELGRGRRERLIDRACCEGVSDC